MERKIVLLPGEVCTVSEVIFVTLLVKACESRLNVQKSHNTQAVATACGRTKHAWRLRVGDESRQSERTCFKEETVNPVGDLERAEPSNGTKRENSSRKESCIG